MTNTRNIKRFYVMPEVWVTVTQSQVFNWIKIINENGISTDCISITDTKTDKESVKKIEDSILGKFYEVHNFKRLLINDIYFTFVIFGFYIKNVFKHDQIIFQTRLSSIGFVFALLGWLPKISFIYEGRGAGNEERKHTYNKKKVTLKEKIKNFFSETNEKLTLKKADKIICVSDALKKYYERKFNLKNKKFKVFPGAADKDIFFYNKSLRDTKRKELRYKVNDIVVVYSGRLEMSWEIPEKIFEFFGDLHAKDNRFKLLLITPDIDIAEKLKTTYNLQNACYEKKTSFEEVNGYLAAADVGILIRENVVMNNVASPTKFAEYLMSGLPVIISSSIHDFSDNINKSGYGVVVENLDKIENSEYAKLKDALNVERSEIAQWGLENLSKESFINEYVSFLREENK